MALSGPSGLPGWRGSGGCSNIRLVPVTKTIKSALPDRVVKAAKAGRRAIRRRTYRGAAVECPLCGGRFSRFAPYHGRNNAACPNCECLERHRMMWLFFTRKTDLFTAGLRVLHIAPEAIFERRFRHLPQLDYMTADLLRKDVDINLDVTNPDLPDESFDVILCSHVLEHVTDDRLAMRELLRITKRGGWAILTAPAFDQYPDTVEDWSITTPAGREAAFGQADHVRVYGRNFAELLSAEGWDVDVTPLPLSDAEAARYGIPEHEQRLYLGRRR